MANVIKEPDGSEGQVLKHLLFIMDGNGRWAKKRLLPRTAGHLAGVKRVKEIVRECFLTYRIPYVSLFCFSSENWNRPEGEKAYLFKLLRDFFKDNIDEFKAMDAKIRVIGDLNDPRIPLDTKAAMEAAMAETKDCRTYVFAALFNYGGRQDILQAAKAVAELTREGKLDPDGLDIHSFEHYLWTDGMPDVDYIVRTSGEMRLSNCYLYQSAYAEYDFPKTYWPDFDKAELKAALREFNGRQRRFGGIKE